MSGFKKQFGYGNSGHSRETFNVLIYRSTFFQYYHYNREFARQLQPTDAFKIVQCHNTIFLKVITYSHTMCI